VKQEYEAYFPSQPRIIVARDRSLTAVNAALSQALARAKRHTCARIWLVRTHVNPSEKAAWASALSGQGQSSTRVGRDGLSVIRVGGSSCP
jgi:hypothetical protein